jgi:hypothetical protein
MVATAAVVLLDRWAASLAARRSTSRRQQADAAAPAPRPPAPPPPPALPPAGQVPARAQERARRVPLHQRRRLPGRVLPRPHGGRGRVRLRAGGPVRGRLEGARLVGGGTGLLVVVPAGVEVWCGAGGRSGGLGTPGAAQARGAPPIPQTAAPLAAARSGPGPLAPPLTLTAPHPHRPSPPSRARCTAAPARSTLPRAPPSRGSTRAGCATATAPAASSTATTTRARGRVGCGRARACSR